MHQNHMLRKTFIIFILFIALSISVLDNLNYFEINHVATEQKPAVSTPDFGAKVPMSSDTDITSPTEIPEPEPVPDSVTIQMGGDVLIHDTVREASATGKNTYDFTDYFSLFEDILVSDLNIVNLEGPTDAYGNNKSVSGFPVFNMPYEILPALKGINVDLCVTANNHTCDKGYTGVKNTLLNVSKSDMDSVGSYIEKEDSKECYVVEINNIKVGVAAFASYTEGSVGSSRKYCVDICGKSEKDMLAAIKPKIDALKENGAEFIVIAIHWGTEYADAPSATQKKVAKKLCEYGADVIMGSHSHCVQPIELLTVDRGGVESQALVIYSLGNLFTNQTALNKPKTQEGMIVSLKAVRDDDGYVRLSESFYMPTYTYVRGTKGKDYMRIVAAGDYAFREEMPSVFKDEAAWEKCKNAWNNVNNTVGNAIPSISGPSDYPEGFFSSTDGVSADADLS